MILVTGAAGKTGRAVMRALAVKAAPVRAFIRRREQQPVVEALGAQEVILGDLREPSSLEKAVQGVQAVYHICPNISPHEFAIGSALITAAAAAGVAHFVFHSVLHPQTEAMPHHWQKLRVEEQLFASGLPFTILQPTAYMQNILAYWPQITNGEYPVPYDVNTATSLVDLRDVAAVAAQVLTQSGHSGATYELVGTTSITPSEIAAALSRHLEQPVTARQIPLDEWQRQARANGLKGYPRESLLKMFAYYQQFGLSGNANVLTWLLGRAPTTLEQFLSDSRNL